MLDPGFLHYRNGPDALESYDWDGIISAKIDLPSSRFKYSAALSGSLLSLLTIFIQDDPNIDPADGSVTLTTSDETSTLPVARHHIGGYWSKTLTATQRLVDRLVDDAPSRLLLDRPEELLRSIKSLGSRS